MLSTLAHSRLGRFRLTNQISEPMDLLPASPIERPLYVGGSVVKMTLESALWKALDEICVREKVTVEEMISTLSDRWETEEVTSLLWQYSVTYFQDAMPPWRPDRSEYDGGAFLRKVLGDISAAS
jgi:predicted DNA-binding ribbon-helix-helix protein